MKRLIPVIIAVVLVLSMSVPSFAYYTGTIPNMTREGDDIRINGIVTSTLTDPQKDFMRSWFAGGGTGKKTLLIYENFGTQDDLIFYIVPADVNLTRTTDGSTSKRFQFTNKISVLYFRYESTSKTYKAFVGGFSENTDSMLVPAARIMGSFNHNLLDPEFQLKYDGSCYIDDDGGLSAPPVTKHDLTINYQYSNGMEAVGTYRGSFDEGTTYDIPSPVISGYVPDKTAVIGTMPSTDVTETVTYSKKKTTLTIEYLYADGSEAAPTFIGEYDVGENVSITPPVIDGFSPFPLVVSGVLLGFEGGTHVTVTYRKDSLPPVSSSEPSSSEDSSSGGSSSDTAEKYDLTIDYQNPDGTDLAGAYQAEIAEGETYNVPSPTIGGYIPDRYSVFGTMPRRAVTETVIYLQGSGGGGTSGNPYVPWNVGLLYTAVGNLRSSIGVAFDIGIWIFMLVTGIYVVMKIVNSIGN